MLNQCHLLHDVLRSRQIGHQRHDVAKNLAFAAQKQGEEPLLGSGMLRSYPYFRPQGFWTKI